MTQTGENICSFVLNRADLYRTLQTGDQFGIPKRQVSGGGVQCLWLNTESKAYVFHRGQFCHVGVGEDADLWAKCE